MKSDYDEIKGPRAMRAFNAAEGGPEPRSPRYEFNGVDLGIITDHGTTYSLYGSGETVDELLEELTIEEVDQDGGEVACFGYGDAPDDAQRAVDALIYRLAWRSA